MPQGKIILIKAKFGSRMIARIVFYLNSYVKLKKIYFFHFIHLPFESLYFPHLFFHSDSIRIHTEHKPGCSNFDENSAKQKIWVPVYGPILVDLATVY